jgi:acetyl/propionyl-CoA carboxylase alpha subunit
VLGEVAWPDMEGVRVDTWVETGAEVTPYYDSLLAKLMVFAPDRPAAIAKLQDALAATKVLQLYCQMQTCPTACLQWTGKSSACPKGLP